MGDVFFLLCNSRLLVSFHQRIIPPGGIARVLLNYKLKPLPVFCAKNINKQKKKANLIVGPFQEEVRLLTSAIPWGQGDDKFPTFDGTMDKQGFNFSNCLIPDIR